MKPLVTVEELAALPGAVLVDARSGAAGRDAYARSHLAGAVHADLDRDLAAHTDRPERGGRHPLPDVAAFAAGIGRAGIGPDSTVVVYDDQGGANAAARFWWMLRALGHERVAVLDGGWQRAVARALPTDAEAPSPADRGAYPATRWGLPTADIEAVDAARGDPTRRVVDVRAAFRYRGEREPIDPVAGHIPGALNLPYEDALTPEGTFLDAATLRERFERALGADPSRVIVHCGSGVTACHTLLAMEHAGLPGAALYVGSWGEWCRQPARPVARG